MAEESMQKGKSVESLKPVYLIYGEEEKLLEEAVDRLKASFEEEGDLNFSFDQFFGDKDDAQAVIQAAQTLPFMSSKRLILVKNASEFNPSDTKALAEYLKKPSPTTCLVLVASELKKTSLIYKAANKTGQVFEYKLPSKNEYPNWVKKKFRSKGKMVTGGVPKLMVESIGYNLNRLENEIEKVSLYFDDKAEINEDDISMLICESGEKSIFDLVDSIGKRDKNSAFSCLNHIMEQKSDPPQLIFFMIVRQFRLLLKTKALIDRDLPDGVIAKELKVPFFVAKKLRDQCGNFSLQKLEAIYRVLTEMDKALKTSEREPKLLLEGLILQVTE